jgi:3(or 17)beta-hydroxysteroid dehydrogenase
MRLDQKIALVTGAATGIGAAIARRFVAEGATVFASDINREKGELLAKELGQSLIFEHQDVTDESGWIAMKARIGAAFGHLDILVNNAGIVLPNDDIEHADAATWTKTQSVNSTAVFLGCHTMLDLLKKSRAASVVNISSVVVFKPRVEVSYVASKAAVWGLTRSMAIYCAQNNYPIRCNAVHPGGIETDMISGFLRQAPDPAALRSQIVAGHLIKRFGQPDELVGGIVYLASDESSFVTGTSLSIDGGMSIA